VGILPATKTPPDANDPAADAPRVRRTTSIAEWGTAEHSRWTRDSIRTHSGYVRHGSRTRTSACGGILRTSRTVETTPTEPPPPPPSSAALLVAASDNFDSIRPRSDGASVDSAVDERGRDSRSTKTRSGRCDIDRSLPLFVPTAIISLLVRPQGHSSDLTDSYLRAR